MMVSIFCDFDLTITDSIAAYVAAYNEIYLGHKDFVPADHTLVNTYDLKDQCPLVKITEEKLRIFESLEFWYSLEFMTHAYEVLQRLCNNDKFKVIICSIGTKINISRKAKWIEKHLPFVKNCIFINNGNSSMDKSIIDMSGGLIVDDVAENLKTSNARWKICYGKEYDWNKDLPKDSIRIENWLDVEKFITQKGDLVER